MGGIATKNQREKAIEKIQGFRYIDDIFFNVAFDGFKAGVELILRIVLGDESIVVDEILTQKDIANWYGRSVRLDVFASANGKRFNCEIQRSPAGAIPKRARYNSSLMDARESKSGTDFSELPDIIVIMICEHDLFQSGLPLYHIKKIVAETGAEFNDGSSVVYVNGQCQDDTPLGRLMHDFFCREAKDMYNQVLAERMAHFKENKGGVQAMCEAMDELIREAKQEEEAKAFGKTLTSIRNLMQSLNMTAKQVMDAMKIPSEEQEKLLAAL